MDPEEAPDTNGRPVPGTCYAGLALALIPARTTNAPMRMRIVVGGETPARGAPAGEQGLELFRLHALLTMMHERVPGATSVVQMLDDGPGADARIELTRGPCEARHDRNGAPANGACRNGSVGAPLACPSGVQTAEGQR
jgi:hypothetical protein